MVAQAVGLFGTNTGRAKCFIFFIKNVYLFGENFIYMRVLVKAIKAVLVGIR